MDILTNLKLAGSFLILHNSSDFPSNPTFGQLCLTGGMLYIYSTISGITDWFPLTNRINYYVHHQSTSALTWNIEHDLGSNDLLYMVYDSTSVMQLAEMEIVDVNNITIQLVEAATGKAIIFSASGSAVGGSSVDLENYVEKSTTVNGHSLSNNVTVTKSDVGLGAIDALYALSGTSITVDGANGTTQTLTLSGNTTINWNLPSSGTSSVRLIITQATGTHFDVTNWNNVKWSGSAPTISAVDGAVDIVSLLLTPTAVYGVYNQEFA